MIYIVILFVIVFASGILYVISNYHLAVKE